MKLRHLTTESESVEMQSPKQLYLFPLYLPDELHVSQFARYHDGSGNVSARYSYQELYDSAPFRLTHWIPQRLERFAEKLPGSHLKNIEELLRRTTLFPLFETYSNATLNLTDDASSITKQIVNMPKRIVGESGEIHLCMDCLKSDCEEFGQPYIHCSHQIPGVLVCWRHGCRLISNCPSCGCPFERKNEFVLVPWEPCEGCGLILYDVPFYTPMRGVSDLEISYADFARDMLLTPTVPMDAQKLAAVYKARLIEMGFSRGSQINHTAIVQALEEHFGQDGLAQIDVAYRYKKNQQWFRLCCASSVIDVPLPRHLALTHFLFGSASKFLEFSAKNMFDVQMAERPIEKIILPVLGANCSEQILYSKAKLTSDELISEKKSSRMRIQNILRENTGWTEVDLWRMHPGLMKRLLRHHDDGFVWLKELLVTIKATENKKRIPQALEQHPDDLKWAQAFAKAAITLYASTEKPMKISRNFLMRAAGWGKGNMPSHERFPLARQQLEALCESDWHFYARRILWTKLRAGAAGSSDRGVLGTSGIEHHQGRLVIEYFSSLPVNRILRLGTIMEILKEYKISKDWEGPLREQKFLRPGRNASRGGYL